MKKVRAALAAAAAAAAAPAALAQTWQIDSPGVFVGRPSAPVTLSLDPGPGSDYIAGVNFSVHASESGWSDQEVLIPPAAAPPGSQNPGTISGASVLGISTGQLTPILGFTPVPGRIEVWRATFTIDDFTARSIDVWTETDRLDVYIGEWPRETRIPTEARRDIFLIPSPGAAALLAMGCFAAGRRRRPGPAAHVAIHS